MVIFKKKKKEKPQKRKPKTKTKTIYAKTYNLVRYLIRYRTVPFCIDISKQQFLKINDEGHIFHHFIISPYRTVSYR